MTEEDEEQYKNNNICRYCEKNFENDKARDHFHLTGKYRGPACSKCNINVTQKQSNFTQFVCHNFSNYDCYQFFEKLVDEKKEEFKFDIIPKTDTH